MRLAAHLDAATDGARLRAYTYIHTYVYIYIYTHTRREDARREDAHRRRGHQTHRAVRRRSLAIGVAINHLNRNPSDRYVGHRDGASAERFGDDAAWE